MHAMAAAEGKDDAHEKNAYLHADDYLSSGSYGSGTLTPGSPATPGLSRSSSSSGLADGQFESDAFPPLDRLTMFDILENLALPQRLEKLQNFTSTQQHKLREQRQKLTSRAVSSKKIVVEEWRKRVPQPEEQLEKYRRRMRDSVDRLGRRWNDAKTVTMNEKTSFVGACLNIFISGYLVGAFPQYFYIWYTAQLLYFMPLRWRHYHRIGFHYFLADLCYFVNLLLILSMWFFPKSKRLFISTYCLAFGNNAVAIAMWRNSLVFHSMDKVISLFIHIMPCVTIHCLVHLIPKDMQRAQFPAIYSIKYSAPDSPEHYTLWDMIVWATVPYAIWQLSYHLLITIRRREKIAAGRPTSFTWLRRSYASNVLGRLVLSLPDALQEPAFMGIQYGYALLTMVPCPLWFSSRWASAAFLMLVFTWACWNGATYYIDVFGRRLEKELRQLRDEVARMSKSPDGLASPLGSPDGPRGMAMGGDGAVGVNGALGAATGLDLGPAASRADAVHRRARSVDDFPLLDGGTGTDYVALEHDPHDAPAGQAQKEV